MLHIPNYNNGIPKVNTFGTVNFTGGMDVDGWIGYNPASVSAQQIEVIPDLSSFGSKFLITFDVEWFAPAGSRESEFICTAIAVRSDKTNADENSLYIAAYTGMIKSTSRDRVVYMDNNGMEVERSLATIGRVFNLGCYVDTSLKRCYLGVFRDDYEPDVLQITANPSGLNYLTYTINLTSIRFPISVLAQKFATNHYRNIVIKKISNVDVSTGKITYL